MNQCSGLGKAHQKVQFSNRKDQPSALSLPVSRGRGIAQDTVLAQKCRSAMGDSVFWGLIVEPGKPSAYVSRRNLQNTMLASQNTADLRSVSASVLRSTCLCAGSAAGGC